MGSSPSLEPKTTSKLVGNKVFQETSIMMYPRKSKRKLFLFIALVLIVLALATTTTLLSLIYIQPYRTILRTRGTVLSGFNLTLKSFPNPSKGNQSVAISGRLVDVTATASQQRSVVIHYSKNLLKWEFLSEVVTDYAGDFSLIWKPSQKGQLYIRANATGKVVILEHVVADYIVAQDGRGDFANIQTAISTLSHAGGTIFVKNGTYLMDERVVISNKSNVVLIGDGYNAKLTKSWGMIFRIENVTNLTIRKLHFHHLTNNYYEAISVKGFNDGITIDACWFTRDVGSLGNYIDLVFFDPDGATKNLQIKNSYFRDAQIDALAIKKVTGGIIENNTIIDAATNTVNGLGSGMTIEGSSNLTIKGNYIKRTGNQSMGGVNIFGDSKHIFVEGNTIMNVEWGVHLHRVSNVSIENNIIIDPFSSGVHSTETWDVSIKDNRIEQVEFDRKVIGVFLFNNSKTTLIQNTIKNTHSGIVILNSSWTIVSSSLIDIGAQTSIAKGYGVLVYQSSNTDINNNTITRSYGIGVSISRSTRTTVHSNIIAENMRSGVRLLLSNNSMVVQNILKNNGIDFQPIIPEVESA